MISPRNVIFAALALGACNQAEPAQDETGAAPSAETAASTGDAAAPAASLWNDGQVRPLDIQVAHASGAVLQLTSLQSRPTDTVVGLRIMNGRDRDIDLNRFPNNRNGYLLLDTGERLYLSPPVSNPRLSIPAGQTFEGELVFLGRLEPVQAAVMVLNENYSTSSEHTNTPGFRIDLPLAAAGAEGSQ